MENDDDIEAPHLDDRLLEDLERTAAGLARRAGEHIAAAVGADLTVAFKGTAANACANASPVSNVDREVEALLRAQLAERWPAHAVIGEETDEASGDAPRFVWVLDPLDGTTNFLNGLPLFASAVGVLCDGYPVAGATWCATSHALHPGVYHARSGGALRFDGAPLARRASAAWRGLAAEPGRAPTYGAHWDTRMLGSTALECALVASGVLRLALLSRPRIWDVAAGLPLLHAVGCEAWIRTEAAWARLRRFTIPGRITRLAELRRWSARLLVGSREALGTATSAS